MSIFKGHMDEFENVLVDNFVEYESFTCFFLTHCHTDHMTDLHKLLPTLKERPDHFLYCSPISRLILLNKYHSSYDSVIKPIISTSIIVVPKNNKSADYEITVTSIPAGHCPGSVMFLFETVNKCVLYTGDFRIMEGDVKKFKQLHRNDEVIPIGKVYFDSTFLNELHWYFPQRSEVVKKLTTLIKNWLNKDFKHHVLLLTSALYGYEFVFTELAKHLRCKIHVKDFVYDLYWNVPEVGFVLTKDSRETKIHARMKGENFNKFPNIKTKHLLTIILSAYWYKSPKNSNHKPILKRFCNQIKICYSTHCSCSELLSFLNYLQPKELEPCCHAANSSDEERDEYIQKLIWSWPIKSNKRLKLDNSKPARIEENQTMKIKFPNFEEITYENFI